MRPSSIGFIRNDRQVAALTVKNECIVYPYYGILSSPIDDRVSLM